jgi:hypothetical protein
MERLNQELKRRTQVVRFAVAAVGGAQEREERGVLRNGHELTVAKRPSSGREIEGENADFAEKWV